MRSKKVCEINKLYRNENLFDAVLVWFKHLHNIQFLRDRIDFEYFDLPWCRFPTATRCSQTLIAFVAACSSLSRCDPDASFHTRCRPDEAAQTDSRTLASLSISLDNESNVLASRNPHSAVNTKCLILLTHFSVKLIFSWSNYQFVCLCSPNICQAREICVNFCLSYFVFETQKIEEKTKVSIRTQESNEDINMSEYRF